MKELTGEQIEYATARLGCLIEFQGLNQQQLARLSGVPQPTISNMMRRARGNTEEGKKPYLPSVDVLKKLYRAVGYKLADILNESDATPQEISGYLATPLTDVVKDKKRGDELGKVVDRIKAAAADETAPPPFEIYWPGDFTHPTKNPEFSSSQVYRLDRARASTFDFLIMFCAEPSYGVGQENEIATQAGVPAIRLIPEGVSRMMAGAFIKAVDIPFSGTLETHIDFSIEKLTDALKQTRLACFRHRALYKNMNFDGFGPRLKRLIDERIGDYQQFAHELGVNVAYLQTLMEQPFSVSNPSGRLLTRMAALLQERVGYLIGESEEADAVWVQSNLAWHAWIIESEGADGRIAVQMRDDWRKGYFEERRLAVRRDFRSIPRTVADWEKCYRQITKKGGSDARQRTMFDQH